MTPSIAPGGPCLLRIGVTADRVGVRHMVVRAGSRSIALRFVVLP